jgi:glycosyltransferase involved in cell wall biosynthesis
MTRRKPRALLVSPLAPDLTGNGLAMRSGMFLEALARVAAVDLLILPVSSSRPPGPFAEQLARRIRTIRVAGRVDTQWQLVSMTKSPAARLAAFEAYGRGSRHAFTSLPVLAEVRAATDGERYDLVHAERLYLSEAAIAVEAPHQTLDLDEDDAWAWRQAATDDSQDWNEAEAKAEDRLLARVAPCVDRLYISNENDRQAIMSRNPGVDPVIVPNAVPVPVELDRADDGRTVLFVGSFGYAPNVEGIRWFATEVLPLIPADVDLRVRVVGRGTEALRALASDPRIEIVGEVDDLAPLYRSAALAIAPLFTGGGTRLKVIEALAQGVPMVATGAALHGIEVEGSIVWRADDAPAFAAAVGAALGDAGERQARAAAGRRLVVERHDRERVVTGLAKSFAALMEAGR